MAVRRPLVHIDGDIRELPQEDELPGVVVAERVASPIAAIDEQGNPHIVFSEQGVVLTMVNPDVA